MSVAAQQELDTWAEQSSDVKVMSLLLAAACAARGPHVLIAPGNYRLMMLSELSVKDGYTREHATLQ